MSKNEWDVYAEDIYEYFKNTDEDTIVQNAIQKFKEIPMDTKELITDGLRGLDFLPGMIDEEKDDFSLIRIYVNMLKNRIEDFKWMYDKLADHRSKVTYLKIVRYWLFFDITELLMSKETAFRDYFDLDIIPDASDAVLADCGAYTGDTIIDFYHTYSGDYRRIYAYEMVESTFNVLVNNTMELSNIIYRNCGVGKEKTSLFIDDDSWDAGSRLTDHGSVQVDVVSLDEDIREPLSIIKMDIEGAEMDALEGAKQHILNEKPALLISAYHKPNDFFDIPRWIYEQRDDYRIYLRMNGKSAWPADFIVIAV